MATVVQEEVTVSLSEEFLEGARESGAYRRLVSALQQGVDLASSGDVDALLDHLVRPCAVLLSDRAAVVTHHRCFTEPRPV